MGLGTLAQPYAWNGSTWVLGNGSNKGMWAYNGTSWEQVRELYAYDGSWKKVHPMYSSNAIIWAYSNGSCPSSNATMRIRAYWVGPLPQYISGTDTSYATKFYKRSSSTSAAHLATLGWQYQGLGPGLTTASQEVGYGTSYIIKRFEPIVRWEQGQVRMTHSVDGELTGAQHVRSTSVISFGIDECGPE